MRISWARIVSCVGVWALALPLAAAEPWKPLFNGKDLSGWEHVGPGRFVVEDGMLKTEGGMGFLWYTREKIGKAVLRVVYKLSNSDDNSGIFIRIPHPPKDEWDPVHHAYEVQVLDNPAEWQADPYHWTGAIYSISKAQIKAVKPIGEWNTYEISLDGPRTIVFLNGQKVNDYTEGQPVPPRKKWFETERGPRPDFGYIGLQNHHKGAEVYYKEVSVKPLEK